MGDNHISKYNHITYIAGLKKVKKCGLTFNPKPNGPHLQFKNTNTILIPN